MTPVERAAMRSLIAELAIARKEIRRLEARKAMYQKAARKAEMEAKYLHGVMVARGVQV